MNASRRDLVLASAGLLAATVLPRVAGAAEPQAAAVDAGLAYFRKRNAEQKPLVAALTKALSGSDRAAAEAAYVASRAPYEEIEVLAANFEEIDKDIDSRAYAHDLGDTDPGFKGFHKIEALLFGEGDLAAALPLARGLEASVAALDKALNERERFSAKDSFKGMIALANEIGAKKISGEEETWSDRSLLIFRYNLAGIESQYRPFAVSVAAKKPALAQEIDKSLAAAKAVVDALYGGEPGGAAYSRVGARERRGIVKSSVAVRDGLIAASEELGAA
ncbi:EfeM/EfeO family lipoprotein [Bosea sp. (in: a-proteobacteria)]|uniref:EfeM/EfeO family lipoprotein n=1 Tax=Bosea sp. (in: a-proteobacteria) TaxID=1871050 RepID=UPI001ACC58A8|nr:EfeM/EfeO family lipoprotein [Bosea sp. (in: a-proteobacteria)]MBN9437327.1 EfeM/EfeO family lipoprotein [Bosea sp. (in: a-proteobacteria)]